MWSYSYSQEANTSPNKIWQLWVDVENWNRWDHSIRYSSINGRFAVGTKGTLRPQKGPKSSFTLTEVVSNSKFTDQMKLPFASIAFIHEIKPTAAGMHITHRIEIHGLLAPLFGATLGRQLKAELPTAVANLIELAEQENE